MLVGIAKRLYAVVLRMHDVKGQDARTVALECRENESAVRSVGDEIELAASPHADGAAAQGAFAVNGIGDDHAVQFERAERHLGGLDHDFQKLRSGDRFALVFCRPGWLLYCLAALAMTLISYLL